jgi:hypothetical protein
MARGRFPLVRLIGVAAALALAALVLSWFGRDARGDGDVWRRGLVAGEQVRLQGNGRYQLQRWSWFGADETLESGTWMQLGEVVSLVPSTGGKPARLMRKAVRGERWYLIDPAEPDADAMYERVD